MALHEYFSDALFCSPEKHCIFNKVDKLYKSEHVFSLVLPFFNLFFFCLHSSERCGRAFVVAFFVHILQNIRKNIITNIEFVATTDSIPLVLGIVRMHMCASAFSHHRNSQNFLSFQTFHFIFSSSPQHTFYYASSIHMQYDKMYSCKWWNIVYSILCFESSIFFRMYAYAFCCCQSCRCYASMMHSISDKIENGLMYGFAPHSERMNRANGWTSCIVAMWCFTVFGLE